MHACMHTHACMHAYTHYIQICMHVHMYMYTHTHTLHTLFFPHTNRSPAETTWTYVHVYTHTYSTHLMHAHMYMFTHIHALHTLFFPHTNSSPAETNHCAAHTVGLFHSARPAYRLICTYVYICVSVCEKPIVVLHILVAYFIVHDLHTDWYARMYVYVCLCVRNQLLCGTYWWPIS